MLQLLLTIFVISGQQTSDWPQWRGPTRDGVWHETQLPERFPKDAKPLWKVPVGAGYGGIAVLQDRLLVMDKPTDPKDSERVLCLDATTGKMIWQHTYNAPYNKLDYGNGPRTTPTIHQGKVYTFGAVGDIHCLDFSTGKIIWHRNTLKDFNAKYPTWGYSSSPLVDENRVLLQIGGKPDACFIALDKDSGNEIWRSSGDRPGYASAKITEMDGKKQIVWWSAQHACGLNPTDGKVLWKYPVAMDYDVAITDVLFHQGIFLASDYWTGSKAVKLEKGEAKLAWEGKQLSQLMCSPLVRDGYFYALDRFRGIKCIEATTGKVMWEDESVTPRGRNPQASMVWVDKRALIFNEKGELILAEMTPQGFKKLDQVSVCEFTWAHPAFARGCVFARTDKDLTCLRLFGK